MSDYINIGFVAKEVQERNFINKCAKVISRSNSFKLISCKYPLDENYSEWCEDENISIEAALEKCCKSNMAELICEYILFDKTIRNSVLRIKKDFGLYCFLLEIPSENFNLNNDIDTVENEVITFMRNALHDSFDYAFCDSEADFYDYFAKPQSRKNPYSIFISFNGNYSKTELSPWKIDGFTERLYYICPVCGYDRLDEPPYIDGYIPSHNICDCCGSEFGLDDCTQKSIEENRKKWIEAGCQWFDIEKKPPNWKLDEQLKNLY